jgi:hypothetical protein
VPPETDQFEFLKRVYQNLAEDEPLKPGDPRYEPVYALPGCEDPVRELERKIRFAGRESISFFSGFRGSGKTTELFRLREKLEGLGYTVLYADALQYLNPALPIEIQDLLIVLAGAFGDALEAQDIDITSDSYWTRLYNWLTTTEVITKEMELKAGGTGLKLELRASPTFRQKITTALSGRLNELHGNVLNFFEDGFKAVRKKHGRDAQVVFIFDSLEQIRGSLSEEELVIRSVERLFANHTKLLAIPYVHAVYTVPPWLKFVLPGVQMTVLPCVRLWDNDKPRSECSPGVVGFQSLVEKRFTKEGFERFFGPKPWDRAKRLLDLCGGHFRDLLLLLRATVLRADELPVSEKAIDDAIISVRSSFLPVALDDAMWLAQIEEKRASLLKSNEPSEINRLTRFLDTHIVLYLKNGEEWYDVHPLIRKEVMTIAQAAAAAEPS